MKTIFKYTLIICCLVSATACKKGWLDRQPRNILIDDQVWNDPKQIIGLLANYYDRLPTDMGLVDIANNNIDINQSRQAQWRNMADYDDAMWSGYAGEDGRNNIGAYSFDRWRLWNYSLIRDINLAIEKITEVSVKLTDAQKTQFISELRFLRAFNYFELVKRMGGVPLITTTLVYDFSGDPSSLQQPRAKEFEIYDFVASECDAIAESLGNVAGNGTPSVSRANKWTALALKSRAMLYAGSLAKYNNALGVPITTAGQEVGIPASKSNEYYTKALDASNLILNSGVFALYKGNPNKGENFYEAVTKKLGNKETIFVWDYLTAKNKRHLFSYDNIARNIREDNLASSCVTPSLNLVEHFEYLDGSPGTIKTHLPDQSDFIYYTNLADIFANKDARLYGTVIYPGATMKGQNVEMQAGVMQWNGTGYTTFEGSNLSSFHTDGKLLIGGSGPHRSIQEVTNTGFYLRKYIDAGAGTSTRGIQSDTWWVWFRLGEIYLNAAEAAFELGLTTDAVGFVNQVRERAGFLPNSLTVADLTVDRLRNERRVELAFEDHRVWDLRRWRIAHQVWNGDIASQDANVFALYPYRVVRPGDAARDGKYVFVRLTAPRFRAPRLFQMGNYYSSIDQSVLNNNPKIVRNPFH